MYVPPVCPAGTVSVPPTEKVSCPPFDNCPEVTDGIVVKDIVRGPEETVPG